MKKFVAILATLAITATLLSGCSQGSNSGGGTLRMVTNAEFHPFEFVVPSGGLVGIYDGIDIAIALEIANEAGKELVIENVSFEAVLIQLANGMADFAIAGITIREDRAETVDFSIPYFRATQYILTLEGSDITSANDLFDKNVGVVTGFTGQIIAMDDLRLPNVSPYANPATAVMSLQQGSIDALIIDSLTATTFAQMHDNLAIVRDDDAFDGEYYGIAVPKGDTEMLELVNRVLTRMLADGEIDRLVAYYSSQDE